MSDTEQRIRGAIDQLEDDYEIVELSVNRGTVDAYVNTEADPSELRNLVEQEFSDAMLIGLDVQNEAMEDFGDLIKHVNFGYRD